MAEMAETGEAAGYRLITNDTGRVFRVGETPQQLLGYPRSAVIWAAWFVMCLSGLVEYTWGALNGSLQAAHHWGDAPVFWLFSFFVIFESFVQIGTGFLRNRGTLPVRWAVMAGGLICGILAYSITAYSTNIMEAYFGYAFLGGVGSGMVYSSAISIVAKWYPEKKGWRTGFVNGGWAYGSVPFILALGGSFAGGVAALVMTGTLYGAATFNWERGFWFGAALGALAAVVVYFKCKPPTKEQYERALAKSGESAKARETAKA